MIDVRIAQQRPQVRRLAVSAVCVVAALLAWSGIATRPAAAAVPGLTRVMATSTFDTSPTSGVIGYCPDDTVLLSASYEMIGGGNDVRLLSLDGTTTPPKAVQLHTITDSDGVEPTGWSGTPWGARVILICARPGFRQEVTRTYGPVSSSSLQSAVARCPAGMSVLGVGGGVDWYPTARHIVIDENFTPNATLTAASVTAQEDETGTPDEWRVRAMAICSEPLPGLQRVAATSAGGSASYKSVTATCPEGKRVVGSGGDIRRAGGQVTMTAVAPTPDLTAVRVQAYEDDTGTDANWYAVAYAVCAYP